ncbi:MAG: hypothetical protein ACP5KE_06645 [Candidatus Methanodesulfokora sp.]
MMEYGVEEKKEEEYKVCPLIQMECWKENCMWFKDGKCVMLLIAERVRK